MKKLILIDNYDSFTYNLLHYAQSLGADVEVLRNDADSVSSILARGADGIIISPGPASPSEAGICLELIEQGKDKIPMLGVCLGHQALGQAFGGEVVRMSPVMHGKTSLIHHTDEGVFKGLKNPFTATRYHSLIVKRDTLPDCLKITAETEDGTIMGLQHKDYPLHGVQFHPESIASEHGHDLLNNFLKLL
jgi:anthranilate synthase component 2